MLYLVLYVCFTVYVVTSIFLTTSDLCAVFLNVC
jgi:hypothetical protein